MNCNNNEKNRNHPYRPNNYNNSPKTHQFNRYTQKRKYLINNSLDAKFFIHPMSMYDTSGIDFTNLREIGAIISESNTLKTLNNKIFF